MKLIGTLPVSASRKYPLYEWQSGEQGAENVNENIYSDQFSNYIYFLTYVLVC